MQAREVMVAYKRLKLNIVRMRVKKAADGKLMKELSEVALHLKRQLYVLPVGADDGENNIVVTANTEASIHDLLALHTKVEGSVFDAYHLAAALSRQLRKAARTIETIESLQSARQHS